MSPTSTIHRQKHERSARGRRWGAALLILATLELGGLAAGGGGDATADAAALTGVVQLVDLERLLVAVTSERGVAHALSLSRAEVAAGIGRGDRVVIELDRDGLVRKITKAELPPTREDIPGR